MPQNIGSKQARGIPGHFLFIKIIYMIRKITYSGGLYASVEGLAKSIELTRSFLDLAMVYKLIDDTGMSRAMTFEVSTEPLDNPSLTLFNYGRSASSPHIFDTYRTKVGTTANLCREGLEQVFGGVPQTIYIKKVIEEACLPCIYSQIKSNR